MLTKEQCNKIRARRELTHERVWYPDNDDSNFMNHAYTDIPALLDALDEMEAERNDHATANNVATVNMMMLKDAYNNVSKRAEALERAVCNVALPCDSCANNNNDGYGFCKCCDHNRVGDIFKSYWLFDETRFAEGGEHECSDSNGAMIAGN